VFDYLLTEAVDPAPLDTVAAAWSRHRAVARRFDRPIDVAIAAGFGADRLGFAFLSGYQEALRTLIADLPADELVAVSATEATGAHPSAIRTTLLETGGRWSVRGTKSFTTLGIMAQRLLVIASSGESPDGRNRLHAVLVDADAPGVRVTNLPAISFAPEIPHATVTFTDAPARMLPGDGYLDYLKPFRTVEDIHVLAAALGWLIRVSRQSGWPQSVVQRLLAAVATVRGLDIGRPSSPGVHVALGGALEIFDRLSGELEPLWESADREVLARWERDRPLLATAGRVRAQRLTAAWRSLASDTEHRS
jgi:hypothetical protein